MSASITLAHIFRDDIQEEWREDLGTSTDGGEHPEGRVSRMVIRS